MPVVAMVWMPRQQEAKAGVAPLPLSDGCLKFHTTLLRINQALPQHDVSILLSTFSQTGSRVELCVQRVDTKHFNTPTFCSDQKFVSMLQLWTDDSVHLLFAMRIAAARCALQ